ncbi:MAG: GreA/GreB family elongation factor [Bacteroidia bacterium]|nr:GreA/GreB family elongation factor [Bacteroidia bacterium]
MKPLIAESVYNTLLELNHPLVPYLQENLSRALVIKDQSLDNRTISLNSIVDYVYEPGAKPVRIQIVLPEQEDLKRRRVSVLAPISRALLGYKESDVVTAKMPSGEKTFRILRVQNRTEHLKKSGSFLKMTRH